MRKKFLAILALSAFLGSASSPSTASKLENSFQKMGPLINDIFWQAPFVALTIQEVTDVLAARQQKTPAALLYLQDHMNHKIGSLIVSDQVFDVVRQATAAVMSLAHESTAQFAPTEVIDVIDKLFIIKAECTGEDCALKEIDKDFISPDVHALATKIYNMTPPWVPQAQHTKAIKAILKATKPLVLFEGVPGSGKTASALTWIISTLRTLGHQVFATAPNAGGYAALQGDFKKTPEVVKGFADVLKGNLPNGCFLVVDEVYLTAITDFVKLVKVAKKKKIKLIFSGDSLQNLPNTLPIVGLLDPLPIVHLYESNRASDEQQRQFAGRVVQEGLAKAMGNFKDFIFVVPGSSIVDRATSKALEALDKTKPDVSSVLFVGASEDQVESISDAFQKKLVAAGIVSNPLAIKVSYQNFNKSKYQMEERARTLHVGVGTRLFMKEANVALGIVQGAMGTVTKVEGSKITVDFSGKNTVINTAEFNHFDYGYGLSSAASQGMSVNSVFVVLDKSMSLAEVYVALTRHKKTIEIFAPAEQFSAPGLVMTYDWHDQNKIALSRMKPVMAEVLKKP